MKWKSKLIKDILQELRNDLKWSKKIKEANLRSIHLAIFHEPFLSLLLERKKTIESRFSKNKISPYKVIERGDIVILQQHGIVVGLFLVGNVKFFCNLKEDTLRDIENSFGNQLCTRYDPLFWEKRKDVKYASLMIVEEVKRIKPFKSEKRDRRGWVTLQTKADLLFSSI